jgi:hypothetical protein
MPNRKKEGIRAADAKEVGVGNPAEETYRHPNQITNESYVSSVRLSTGYSRAIFGVSRSGEGFTVAT